MPKSTPQYSNELLPVILSSYCLTFPVSYSSSGPKRSKMPKTSFIGSLHKNIFAGFVVSLIALPLGLSLAIASGMPPSAGIVSAIVGGVVVALFGGSHVTIAGPGYSLVVVILTAVTTLAGGDYYQGYLLTLSAIVLAGLIMFVLGLLRMGGLAAFFPSSAIE